MSTIAKRLLPHRVTYRPLTGSGAYGDNFGDPVTDVPCRIQFQNRIVRDAQGNEVVASCTIYFRPQEAPTLGSMVELADGERPIIARAEMTGSRHGHHVVVDIT